MEINIKLRPCKCGKIPIFWESFSPDHNLNGFFIACENVECHTGEEPIFQTKEEAAKNWNSIIHNNIIVDRYRYIIMRNNRTEVLCGYPKYYHFEPINKVNSSEIKTYRSEKTAHNGYGEWNNEVVKVRQTIEVIE